MKCFRWFTKFLILNFSFLIALAFTSCGRKPAAEEALVVPPVNDFEMQNLVSEFPGTVRTAKFAGKVQLIVFFRSDDPASRGTIPDWNGLQKDYAARGFTVVGAIVDDRPADAIAPEVAALGTEFPVGHAGAAVVAAFGGPPAIRAIPTYFLLDRDGRIAASYAGFAPLARLREDLDRLLDGLPLAGPAGEAAP